MRVDAESAYILHSRPFRESSLLVDLFTRDHGRIRVIAKGGRSKKRAAKLLPFSPMQVSWSGRSDLKNLIQFEPDGIPAFLQGERLFTGLYLNELLVRLLPEQDPQPAIYQHYGLLLQAFTADSELEPLLRGFEFFLLEALGYGVVLDLDMESGEAVEAELQYQFSPEGGVTHQFDRRTADHRQLFSGEHLLAIAQGDYQELAVRRSAKRLTRLALQPHLGNQPLRSRELFAASQLATPSTTVG